MGGQVNDCTQAVALLGQHEAEAVLADKGYDSDAIVEHVEAMGAKAVIPPKRNRKVQREHDEDLYKQRNRIERCFSKLKCFRRFATRYEKSKACFQSLVALACAWMHLRLYVDTALQPTSLSHPNWYRICRALRPEPENRASTYRPRKPVQTSRTSSAIPMLHNYPANIRSIFVAQYVSVTST